MDGMQRYRRVGFIIPDKKTFHFCTKLKKIRQRERDLENLSRHVVGVTSPSAPSWPDCVTVLLYLCSIIFHSASYQSPETHKIKGLLCVMIQHLQIKGRKLTDSNLLFISYSTITPVTFTALSKVMVLTAFEQQQQFIVFTLEARGEMKNRKWLAWCWSRAIDWKKGV